AELLLEAGLADEAELHLAVARTQDSEDDRALALAGRACIERRDVAAALSNLDRAAERQARYPDRWAWVGLARFHAGELERSIEAVKEGGPGYAVAGAV